MEAPTVTRTPFRSHLIAGMAGLLFCTLLAMAALLWGGHQARQEVARAELANNVLIGHLRLAALAEGLLRDRARDPGSLDWAAYEAAFDSEIRVLIDLIGQEIALSRREDKADEIQELDQLARIEQQLKPLLRPVGTDAVALQGTAIMSLIGDAITDETAEAQYAQSRARALVKRLDWIALGQGSATLLLVILLVAWIVRGLGQPLERLLSAMQALGAGDLGHRIGSTRTDEFGVLSERFDLMAADLQASRLALDAAQQRLEVDVAARTEQLKSANARLSDIDANRRRFLADVSHELRTPLTVIRGEADVTLRGVDKPVDEYRSALSCVRDQAALLARLVDDLLFIARQESGDVRLRPQTIQIVSLVERLCQDFRSVVERANLQFQFLADLPEYASLVMTGDPDRLRQLFLVLLDNAVRYSKPGGSITVTATRTQHGVRLAVHDTGIGIPAGELEQVFERRHRSANAVRHHAQGSGLGLPLARAIAEAHGGTIALHSDEGEGVTAIVSLPTQTNTMKAIV